MKIYQFTNQTVDTILGYPEAYYGGPTSILDFRVLGDDVGISIVTYTFSGLVFSEPDLDR